MKRCGYSAKVIGDGIIKIDSNKAFTPWNKKLIKQMAQASRLHERLTGRKL